MLLITDDKVETFSEIQSQLEVQKDLNELWVNLLSFVASNRNTSNAEDGEGCNIRYSDRDWENISNGVSQSIQLLTAVNSVLVNKESTKCQSLARMCPVDPNVIDNDLISSILSS
ncbi:hypothetical protein HNY73_013139 [Argiope bruennichi]|uniref:Uncharacterized protein n=1 Tax=Argiope bruennichi TaxID=94029 RepID=A0A8T0EX28_ARGBR|nr:hypothetical protein HNY73_013139 [Argiope bruennichi]